MNRTQVAIVGAGISGLALDHELHDRGVQTVVLEAADRPGGVIRSVRAEGRVLDVGPQRTRLVPSVAGLVDELGLGSQMVAGDPGLPLFVCRDGRLRRVPFSPGGFLATDLFSVRGKLRMLLEPLMAWTGEGPRSGETVASYVTRRLGREGYRYLVGPLYGGIYGSDPDEMLMEHTLSRALETAGVGQGSLMVAALRWMVSGAEPAPPVTFGDGLATLTDALHREAGDRVRLSCPVRAARRSGSGPAGAVGWEVETPEGVVAATRLVLTCPADSAARILSGEAEGAARRLGRLRYNRLAVVHLCGDCELEGYGYQTALSEAEATRGVTWNASLFDRDGVYTAYLGGGLRPEVTDLSDDELGRVARREFRRVTGCPVRALRVSRTRMPAWDRSWSALEGLTLPRGVHVCANYAERAGIPGRLADARKTAAEVASGLA